MPDSNQGELTATERRVAVKRQQLMQNTRQRIFDIALQEFADKGFSGVRVEAIAGLAGVNIRMIYHYFESKQNLYIEVLEFVLGQLRSEELKLKLISIRQVQLRGYYSCMILSKVIFPGIANYNVYCNGRISTKPKP